MRQPDDGKSPDNNELLAAGPGPDYIDALTQGANWDSDHAVAD